MKEETLEFLSYTCYAFIILLGSAIMSWGAYSTGYRVGKKDFEREYIPKFKEHSILIDSLSERVDKVKERQAKLNQCN